MMSTLLWALRLVVDFVGVAAIVGGIALLLAASGSAHRQSRREADGDE